MARPHDDQPPLEQELAGLAELDRFASESDRAAALRAVHRRLENPYTLGYWFWVAVMLCVAVAASKLVGWGLKATGVPAPFSAVLGIVAGVATYLLLYRLIIRWAARPELQRELAQRVAAQGGGLDASRPPTAPADRHATETGNDPMEASAWSSGRGTFGIRVGSPNRDRHFDRCWTEIEVEIDGQPYRFALTPGFWDNCPEFRDSGRTVIRDWLRRHHTLDWPTGEPPRFQLLPLGGGRFRLVG